MSLSMEKTMGTVSEVVGLASAAVTWTTFILTNLMHGSLA